MFGLKLYGHGITFGIDVVIEKSVAFLVQKSDIYYNSTDNIVAE